jgi:hypothetical protein
VGRGAGVQYIQAQQPMLCNSSEPRLCSSARGMQQCHPVTKHDPWHMPHVRSTQCASSCSTDTTLQVPALSSHGLQHGAVSSHNTKARLFFHAVIPHASSQCRQFCLSAIVKVWGCQSPCTCCLAVLLNKHPHTRWHAQYPELKMSHTWNGTTVAVTCTAHRTRQQPCRVPYSHSSGGGPPSDLTCNM